MRPATPLKGAIRVYFFHPFPIVMEGLRKILSDEPRLAVVGETSKAREAISSIIKLKPEVLIMGLEGDDEESLELVREMRQACPGCGILVLTHFLRVDVLLAAFKAGANGYLLKDAGIIEVVRAIQNLGNGMGYIPPSMITPLVQETLKHNPVENNVALNLTSREHEVFQLLAEGANTGKISQKLFISGKTVLSHRSRIMKKLGISNHTQLVKLALSKGIITLGATAIALSMLALACCGELCSLPFAIQSLAGVG